MISYGGGGYGFGSYSNVFISGMAAEVFMSRGVSSNSVIVDIPPLTGNILVAQSPLGTNDISTGRINTSTLSFWLIAKNQPPLVAGK